MYFSPIILTPFHPYFLNYINQPIPIPEMPSISEIFKNKNTLTSAAEKFAQLIPTNGNQSTFSLLTNYMNLNQKYASIQLPQRNDFISLYYTVINRYKSTYGNSKQKHSWSQQDVIILLWIINWLYSQKQINPINFSQKDWTLIASTIPFRSGEDCMYKWLSIRNNQLQEYPWTHQQKIDLASIIEMYHNNQLGQSDSQIDWINVSKRLFERYSGIFRTPKQCKQSWSIILSSKFDRSKKFWSHQQDSALIEAFIKFGRKWKHIATIIQGRSQNAIKNRFTLLSQKYCKKEITSKNDKDLILLVQSKLHQQATHTN